MRAVSLLVLLCCSLLEGQSVSVNDITLSHHEGRENQIQAEEPRIETPATTSTQQSCQPDIYSVLREMSAALAELKVEQRHTTTAVSSMESRLRASESQMEELRKKVQAQAVNQSDMEARFGSELEDLKMKNDDLKSSFNNQVESLKKENEERKVAFSAGLRASGSGHTGPYGTDFPLVYKHIFTNIGNAYNPATGFFTAPIRGVYQFRFHIHGGTGRLVAVDLHKNGHYVAGTHVYQDKHSVSSSNGVTLLLQAGDVVSLKLRANSWVYDSGVHHSTFSGQILFSV
uniref:C1q domain-containing protein n=1 Tax=Pygocentrus nattereri TaxID=42514 RepID=A0A3B4DLW2_PYGNA